MRNLNVGCGRNILEGWHNLDSYPLPGVDLVVDLERCARGPGEAPAIPLPDGSIDQFLLSHVLEHIREPLPMMQELWRVASPGAVMTVRCPYGSSDDAWEDPTHVRGIFLQSFGYFSQPYFWRADYGFRGDWRTDRIVLFVGRESFARLQGVPGLPTAGMLQAVMAERNVVHEVVAQLTCVKPIREPLRELQVEPQILIGESTA
jgi:SAM-dependent methyltransferase